MIRAQDIADAAGVSKTTVSYVFSPDKKELISPKTREKVLAVAAKLGYRPNYLGRALSTKRSYNIALVLPLRCASYMSFHMLGIFHGVLQSAELSDYNLSVFLGVSPRLLERLADQRMDGIIAVGLMSDSSGINKIASYNLPMVVTNRRYPASKKIGCVRSDFQTWFEHEVAWMREARCKKILLLNKADSAESGLELREYAGNMRDVGVNIDIAVIRDDLLKQCEELVNPLEYDGFIVNGSEGEELAQVAKKSGLEAGKDFSVSCFVTEPEQSSTCSSRKWYRNSYQLGAESWKLLMSIISTAKEGRELLIPIIPSQDVEIPPVPSGVGADI